VVDLTRSDSEDSRGASTSFVALEESNRPMSPLSDAPAAMPWTPREVGGAQVERQVTAGDDWSLLQTAKRKRPNNEGPHHADDGPEPARTQEASRSVPSAAVETRAPEKFSCRVCAEDEEGGCIPVYLAPCVCPGAICQSCAFKLSLCPFCKTLIKKVCTTQTAAMSLARVYRASATQSHNFAWKPKKRG
jgi:hypothetical protein